MHDHVETVRFDETLQEFVPCDAPEFDPEILYTGSLKDEWVKKVFGKDVLYQRVRWN